VIQDYLDRLINVRLRDFEIAHHARLPASPPAPEAREPLCPRCKSRFSARDHQPLQPPGRSPRTHRSGMHTVVSTATSSGKSLIYNLAVAEALICDPELRALYLFPIKALTRDQLEALKAFFDSIPHGVAPPFQARVYDGDTTPYERSRIRQKHPNVLLTNPDMLHYALLAFHPKWEEFWRKLRFVIIDEMHSYRGIFGSHVGQVFRRLRRVCRHYGSDPRFILLSATIGNPDELAAGLTGIPGERIAVVSGSGAPQSKRHFVFLRPLDTSQPTHAASMAARLIVSAAKAGLKTIAFTQSRKLTELVHMSVLQADRRLEKKVSSYRAGFLPEERRVIERKLSSGALSAVISTSALELGIDIGGLDLCILVGYPGTVATTWQRGGRVGRSGRESAIILLPGQDALDQYIVNHPAQFFESRYEKAVIDPFNPEILKAHLPCAAAELPIGADEPEFSDKMTAKIWANSPPRASCFRPWRATGGFARPFSPTATSTFAPSVRPTPLSRFWTTRPCRSEERGDSGAQGMSPGAIYLHRGETYQVESLDLEKKVIRATPAQVPYFTRAR